jgi:RNA polymerase sigma-70 factor (ECF subfamily)
MRIRILNVFEVPMEQTDKYYVERCRNGHADDFRFLVRRYQGPLLAHLAGRLGSRDSAEEAAQETFVRAYFAIGRLKKPQSLFSWLLGIGNRVAKERQRNLQRSWQLAESLSQRISAVELSADYALERAVTALPESYRQVVLLRYYGGCSCSQVAEKLGMPLGTVTKNLSRAYAMLRKSLQQNEDCEVRK